MRERVQEGRPGTTESAIGPTQAEYRSVLMSMDMGFFRCRVLLDNAGVPFDYRFLETNTRFAEFTGLQGATGKTARELVPDVEEFWIETYGRVALTGSPARLQEGSASLQRWWDVQAFRIGKPEDREVAVIFTDITASKGVDEERTRLALELETERARLKRVFEKAPAAIATLAGPDHVFVMANPRYQQLVGHREVVGKSVREAFPEVAAQGFYELLDGVYASGEPYIGSSTRIWLEPHPGATKVERYLDFVYQPLFDPQGSVTGIFVHAVDVTEHRRALDELAHAHDEMESRVEERTSRLSALNAELMQVNTELESFTYSVSHDLRAPLRGIDGFAQVLLEDYGDDLDEKARNYLERVRAGAWRIGGIIDSLLSLTRLNRSELRRQPLDLTRKAWDTIERLRLESPGREVNVHVEPNVRATGDSELLRLVLENLLGNAWKFTSRTGGASIEFGSREVSGQRQYYVCDNGAGFDQKFAGKLFQPFQRLHTEEDFEGTGIGLATVQRIVRRHGGRIWAKGDPGKGAAFYFTLGDEALTD